MGTGTGARAVTETGETTETEPETGMEREGGKQKQSRRPDTAIPQAAPFL